MNLPIKKRVTGLILLLLFGLVLVYPVICRPGPATAVNPFGNSGNAKVIKRVFPNGLTLLIKPNPANKVVAVDVFVRMGALYEPEKRRGISKLMQRVLIKGTTTRSAKDIVIETESAGASIDAGIMDYGYGNVSLKTTLEGLDTGLKVLIDLLLHPVFPKAEVEKEKQLMIEQLNATEDQPAAAAFQDYLQLFYGNHPIGLPA
ncbi:MAG: M16 family metallopeptidase, partial [Bacillota bacterium]